VHWSEELTQSAPNMTRDDRAVISSLAKPERRESDGRKDGAQDEP